MKRASIYFMLFLSFSLIMCDKEEEVIRTANANSAENITINSFTAKWEKHSDAVGYELEVSKNEEFSELIFSESISNPNTTSIDITGLEECMLYYYRVKIKFDDSFSDFSNYIKVRTNYGIHTNVEFINNRDLKLSGVYASLSEIDTQAPAIMFLHMYTAGKSHWYNTDLWYDLISEGYLLFAFDFTGHGASEGEVIYDSTLYNKNWSPKDVEAALEFMYNNLEFDHNRLAIVGASMGACFAVGSTSYLNVKLAVSLSAVYKIVSVLYGLDGLHSVFYACSENDGNGSYQDDANNLYAITEEPKEIRILKSIDAHGSFLLDNAELSDDIVDWIVLNL